MQRPLNQFSVVTSVPTGKRLVTSTSFGTNIHKGDWMWLSWWCYN